MKNELKLQIKKMEDDIKNFGFTLLSLEKEALILTPSNEKRGIRMSDLDKKINRETQEWALKGVFK